MKARSVSPELRAAVTRAEGAALGVRLAELTPKPSLKYHLGLGYSPTGRTFGYDPAVTNQGQLNAQLAIDQQLYNGGSFGLTLAQARVDLERAGLVRQLAEADLALAVRLAYADALSASETLAAKAESIRELEEYQTTIELLWRGAAIGSTDRSRTDIRLTSERLELEKAKNADHIARLELAALMGNLGDTVWELTPLPIPSPQGAAADTLFTIASAIASRDKWHADLDAELAKAAAMPEVDLSVDAGLLTSIENLGLSAADRSPMLGASLGIAVTGPIFDWGLNRTAVDQRLSAAQALELDLERQQRDDRRARAELASGLASASSRLEIQTKLVGQAMETYELLRTRYAAGASSSAEVLDAHRDLSDARLALGDIRHELLTLEAQLLHLETTPDHGANEHPQTH